MVLKNQLIFVMTLVGIVLPAIKLYSQEDKIITTIDDPIGTPIFPSLIYVIKNDTVIRYDYEILSDTTIKIIGNPFYYTLDKYNKWVHDNSQTGYIVSWFKRIKPSTFFILYNEMFFHAENEVELRRYRAYTSEGILKSWGFKLGNRFYTKLIMP